MEDFFNNNKFCLLPARLKLLLVYCFLGLLGATFRVVPPIEEGKSYGYSGISSSNKRGCRISFSGINLDESGLSPLILVTEVLLSRMSPPLGLDKFEENKFVKLKDEECFSYF